MGVRRLLTDSRSVGALEFLTGVALTAAGYAILTDAAWNDGNLTWQIMEYDIPGPPELTGLAVGFVMGFPLVDGYRRMDTGQGLLEHVYDGARNAVSESLGFINNYRTGSD